MNEPTRWIAVVFVLLVGCGETLSDETVQDTQCEPACEGRVCGLDGCGGTCGDCGPGGACTSDGECAPDCEESCGSLGLECGEHCGEPCGTCPAGTSCAGGQCSCAPDCAGKTCQDDNGCGAACGPCERLASCEGCPLRLVVVEREIEDGYVRGVTVALEYLPPEGAALPGIADIRVKLDGPVTLSRVGLGEPLLQAQKALAPDPQTGLPYRVLPDGSTQVLVMSASNINRIGGGRWLYFQVELGTGSEPAHTPLIMSLVPGEEILAPAAANEALFGASLTEAVVVWANELPGGADAP